ncbi:MULTISPECIES: ISL3 family transposase [Yersinia pseudotuberculosis complex]|uniref:ISL3 family transposase n=1 Tax=Yersinia pseudotuberculosis complex TaxID=1649845 RepID=UPI0005E7E37F|nr:MULTISPECIES: ISL3 family transposase [Yersinia pseudotuberculosis complex]CFU95224.1 Transposase and inactivated derivatives [Yersinia pseudotuberculosis]CNB81970.1 Transposase and inactivated derivatives [Yersinia pseudotuberculosis]CNB97797.1 Transposase and inactivated derivatives [Yersinia pseudotuberculosis]CRY61336.1 Transposase and inactivated derivatives [Yersinia pseudotuberculosis]SUB29311.1 Transposase and inactivated derivatives [Yersinia pseudotuberculosis]
MASLRTILQLPRGWQVLQQTQDPHGLSINLHATRKSANCPACLTRSRSVHSYRRRRIQHLPCTGQTVHLIFAIRHWYCRNPSCPRQIFAESLAPFTGSRQQASHLLQELQLQLGLIAGGEAGNSAAAGARLLQHAENEK